MEKNPLVDYFYSKPIKKLKELKEGDLVYDSSANLCFVSTSDINDDEKMLHHYCIASYPSQEALVYPVTFRTKEIVDQMQELRKRYHSNKIMNAYISRELDNELDELMSIDDKEENSRQKYDDIWTRLESTYQERIECAKKLHII